MRSSFVQSALFLTVLSALLMPEAAVAQDGYLFRQPIATASFRIGVAGLSAQDDLFDFFTNELTLRRGDFRTGALAADLGLRVAPRADVVIGVGFDHSTNRSEFRHLVDQDNRPIEQTTRLTRIPLTAGLKFYLVERGRSVGRHAWVPVRFTPYVSAGAGWIFYDLTQHGDFVDYETFDVFTTRFSSSGNGATAHIGGGGEWWLSARLAVHADARYAWASAELDRDFADFDRIDLRGFQVTTGLAVRF